MPSTEKFHSITTMPGCTVIPVLEYPDVDGAIKWICTAFGFTIRWRAGNHRAQLELDGGVVVITELKKKIADIEKDTAREDIHSVLVRVKDADAHYKNARANGAKILQEPEDQFYGERQYSVLDLEGHLWMFSQTIKEMTPEEWGAESGDS